jgi:hypothetical protein
LKSGTVIRSRETAVRKKYIQINHPAFVRYLIFDVDREFATFRWELEGLPHPGWAVANKENGFAHLVYPLKSPVCRTDAARTKPLRLLAAIESGYRDRLEADPGYAGLLTKNPLHDFWGLTVFNGSKVYDMAFLADWIDLSKKPEKKIEFSGLGRNCTLFDTVRHWAYGAVKDYWGPNGAEKWQKAVLDCCHKNNTFPVSLPESEIRATAKSIASWTWKRITPAGKHDLVRRTHSTEIQSRRGKKNRERSRDLWESLISHNILECPGTAHHVPQG